MTEDYKEHLADFDKKLYDIYGEVFDSIVNLSMAGEMKEWFDLTKEGESFKLCKEIFTDSNDPNVQLLLNLINTIESTYYSMYVLNKTNLSKGDTPNN